MIRIHMGSGPFLSYPVGQSPSTAKNFAMRAANHFNKIEEYVGRSVNIIARGSSGIILATYFSEYINNTSFIDVVRKPGEMAHNTSVILSGDVKVFIDDFIATGATIVESLNRVKDKYPQFDVVIVQSFGDKIERLDIPQPSYLITE